MEMERGSETDRRGFLVAAARVAVAAGVAAGSLRLLARPGVVSAAPCGLPQSCPKCAVREGCGYLAESPPAAKGRE